MPLVRHHLRQPNAHGSDGRHEGTGRLPRPAVGCAEDFPDPLISLGLRGGPAGRVSHGREKNRLESQRQPGQGGGHRRTGSGSSGIRSKAVAIPSTTARRVSAHTEAASVRPSSIATLVITTSWIPQGTIRSKYERSVFTFNAKPW